MQRYYSIDNIDLNFLCCYADAEIYDDRICFYNHVLKSSMQFNGSCETGKEFLRSLRNGIGDEELIAFIENNYPCDLPAADIYLSMLKNGIVE